MKIKTYNIKTGEETIQTGFVAHSHREAREIAMALGLCMACDTSVEDDYFVISFTPRKAA